MIRHKGLLKVINQFISILTVCAAHAHAELSLAAFTHPVKQLLFATVMIILEVMSLGSELVSTKLNGKHSLNIEL